MLDWAALLDAAAPLVVALVLGGLLGLEREVRGRWAGLRTHMMVALGAALFMNTSVLFGPLPTADLTRVIQGIATGVGFIGAGTILKLTDRIEVKGLTTASTIWLAAAVGTAAGVRLYGLAVCGVLIAVPVLTLLGYAERRYEK